MAVRGLYIVNEGNFQRANASLSFFVPDSGVMYNNVFQHANGRSLGDVGHRIRMHNGLAYVVVNNSHRIEVVDPATHTVVKTIECLPGSSPRDIAFSASGLGYITNLYRNSVSVYHDESNSLIREIPVGPNPEGVATDGARIFVANSGLGNGNTVSVITESVNEVWRTLTVGDYPTAVLNMPGGSIGILCSGAYNDFNDPNDDTPGSLIIIDPMTLNKLDSIPLPGHPMHFILDNKGNAWVIGDDVTRIHLATRTSTPGVIPGFFYGGIFDPVHEKLYLANALDFVQQGMLEVYDLEGNKVSSHTTGIIPGAMAFTQ